MHAKKRKLHIVITALFLLLLLLPGSIRAVAASENVEAKIPVSASGADCTAVLADEENETVQTLALSDGEEKTFSVLLEGLGAHRFSIRLTDKDTDTTTYDKTVYTVDAEVFCDEDYTFFYTITADPVGVIGQDGKPQKLAFVNESAKKICEVDPPVQKKIVGSPAVPGTFSFAMEAKDSTYPMPEGSLDGTKTVNIRGAGDVEFGTITFETAGTYEYTVTETDTKQTGYTYDSAEYTLRYSVTETDGSLSAALTIIKNNDEANAVNTAVFINTYRSAAQRVSSVVAGNGPKTGDNSRIWLWVAVGGAALVLLLLLAFLSYRRKKRGEEKRDEA